MSEQELNFIVDEKTGEGFSAVHQSVPRPGDEIQHRIENHCPGHFAGESRTIEGIVDRVLFESSVSYVPPFGGARNGAGVRVYLKNVKRKPLKVTSNDVNE